MKLKLKRCLSRISFGMVLIGPRQKVEEEILLRYKSRVSAQNLPHKVHKAPELRELLN